MSWNVDTLQRWAVWFEELKYKNKVQSALSHGDFRGVFKADNQPAPFPGGSCLKIGLHFVFSAT